MQLSALGGFLVSACFVLISCGVNTNSVVSPASSNINRRIQGNSYVNTGLEKFVGIFEADLPNQQKSRCSGVFVKDSGGKSWFISAKHCLQQQDPLDRPSTVSLASIPARVFTNLSYPSYVVASTNRLVLGDVIKIDVSNSGLTFPTLPLCDMTIPENTFIFMVGYGLYFNSVPKVGMGNYMSVAPVSPNLAADFSGLQFVRGNAGILYGEPGDSGGPVVHSTGYLQHCVAGAASRQFPLRTDGGFGLTGFTRLSNAILSSTSWKNL